jgi:long-chain acyl-CoA synthetase
VPLTHANLLSNLRAILHEGLITPNDRLLQPLPLHHVYPFALGMLAPLAAGIPIILPYSLTGPQLVRALNDGQATALLGIPRLYSALFSAIEQRIAAAGGPAAARLFSGLLRLSALISRHSSWHPGKLLFAPLRRRFAPRLRMLTSEGAALPADLAWRLDGLGWEVATGYGLTETSPILTVGPPEARRYDSTGRALPGVALHIAPARGGARDGEVLAKGPNVFDGYLDLPEETASVFTDDGWYRTGDLGHLDEAGWLYLSGRASARIVLSGGENVDPEAVENRLTGCPAVREAAVLEHEGRLAALLVPTPEASRQHGRDGLEQQLRREVAEASREAPSHQQIGTIRLTQTPLPRTRLGKLRRHLLEGRFRASGTEAERPSATGLAPFESLAPGDRQLLEDPVAERVWSWLGRRFKQHWITPDTSLRLDLNVDSLEWVSLTMDLQGRLGIALEETAIARIETVRDLLQEAAAAGEAPASRADIEERLRDPEAQLDDDQRAWLAPASGIYRPLGTALHALSRWAMRMVFRLQIAGREHIPETGPCLLAPNHLSALDPVAIIACLDSARRRQTYWGGWTGILFHRPWTRLMSRALQVLPIDPQAAPISSLAFGAAVLARDKILVWFPEGARSTDGSIKPFRPGIGTLALLHSVPIVPLHISGTGKALPPGSWRLRPHAVTVRFGVPLDPEGLEQEGAGETPAERLADALREHVRALAEAG